MKFLFVFALVLAMAATAFAQVNPPLPQNITEVGPINFLGDDGSMVFTSRDVDGRTRMPAGIMAWSAAPFRYRAYFASGDADTVGSLISPVPADTVAADMRGNIQYPVWVVLPGAKWLAADVSDTLWARAYYID